MRAGCSKAEPKIFASPQTPFPGARDGQNLISWRWSLIYLYLQTQFGEDRCTQFRVIVVTDPQTNKQTNTQTGPITIHCAAASAQCKNLLRNIFYTSVSMRNLLLGPCHLGTGAWLTPYRNMLLPTCLTMPNSVILGHTRRA